jgi:hypothetical protein
MNKQVWFNALCYEAGLWAVQQWPSLAFNPWFKRLMEHCRLDWAEWKTIAVMEAVDRQTAPLVEQWDKEEKLAKAGKLAEKAQELFPMATITALPDAIVPSVMIVHNASEEANDAIKALGAELRITWQLPNTR